MLQQTRGSVTVRPADAGDLDAVLALVAELGRPSAHLRDANQRQAALAILGDPDSPVLVAECDGSVVGVATLLLVARMNWATREARLLDLSVAPGARGVGLGRRLVEASIAVARAHGCHVLRLECGHARTAAHRFYERQCFEDRGRDYQLTLRRAP